jgi:dTDP-4-amino-4,6-dideoxygalactose transaminase
LEILEDAAHAIGSTWEGKALGTFGGVGALSFHETKNVTCGEGGAVLVNDPDLIAQAEILQEKGTNRSAFLRGEVDSYSWMEVGSSAVMSDLSAAFLLAQLERLDRINDERRSVFDRYMAGFEGIESESLARRPVVPPEATHNGHLFYLLLAPEIDRDEVIAATRAAGVETAFHFVPLHSSQAGRRVGRVAGPLGRTERAGASLIRLPLWCGMTDGEVDRVIETVDSAVRSRAGT